MYKFKSPTNKKTSQDLAQHVPNGKLWVAKNIEGSVLQRMVESLSTAFNGFLQQVEALSIEFDINKSIELLDDWETSVGIPDDCQGRLMGLEDRRKQVIRKFTKQPIVDLNEIKKYIEEITGQEITLKTGQEVEGFPISFPVVLSSTNSLFKIYLSYVNTELNESFPLSFPVKLGSVEEGLIVCTAGKILPANVVLVIRRS
jgi:hypothetical protein